MPNYSTYSIAALTEVCRHDWKKVHYSAAPYISAMLTMTSVKDSYGADDGVGIVARFLGNARTWTGPIAKEVKAELNKRLKAA